MLRILLFIFSAVLLLQCTPDEGSFDSERDQLLASYDSLESLADARIASLQGSGQAGTSTDENAIRQEIADLNRLKSQIATGKNNLSAAQPHDWRHMRDSLEEQIMVIRDTYFPGPE